MRGYWRQHEMEMLVGVLHHRYRYDSLHIRAFSIQSGSRGGEKFGLEGRAFCKAGRFDFYR